MRIKSLILALSLSVAGQSLFAQSQVVKATEAVMTLIKTTESTSAVVKSLESTAVSLGVSVNELRAMSESEVLTAIKGNANALKDLKHIGVLKNEVVVADGAEVANNVLRSEGKAVDMTASGLPKAPVSSEAYVGHMATIKNYEALQNAPTELQAAYKELFNVDVKLETIARTNGMTALNLDAGFICKNLTIVEGIQVKTIVESRILEGLESGAISSQKQLAEAYVKHLSEELNITRAEAEARVKEMSEPTGCKFLSPQMGRALATL